MLIRHKNSYLDAAEDDRDAVDGGLEDSTLLTTELERAGDSEDDPGPEVDGAALNKDQTRAISRGFGKPTSSFLGLRTVPRAEYWSIVSMTNLSPV